MSRFNFTLKYVLEIKIGKTDGLNKRPYWKMEMENNNENQKLIKEEWIRGIMKVVVEELEKVIKEKIKRTKEKDKEVVKVVEKIKKVGVRNLREDEWEIEGDLVLKEGKVYIPKDKKLRIEITCLYHDVPVAGYERRWKTIELVIRDYWWPGVTKNMGKYVEECDLCQRIKNRTEALAGKLMTNEVPEKA